MKRVRQGKVKDGVEGGEVKGNCPGPPRGSRSSDCKCTTSVKMRSAKLQWKQLTSKEEASSLQKSYESGRAQNRPVQLTPRIFSVLPLSRAYSCMFRWISTGGAAMNTMYGMYSLVLIDFAAWQQPMTVQNDCAKIGQKNL